MGIPESAVSALAAITMLVNLTVLVYWIVVGWRAMRALEDISTTLREKPGR